MTSTNPTPVSTKRDVVYYDLVKKWPKVKRHLDDAELNNILVRDFNKFTEGCWGQKFTHGQFPTEFETCDWQFERRGRHPAYWRYTKHAACHWLVNFTLRLAQLVEPKRPWRIITSQKHSTVWDGGHVLFDFNFRALGVPASECFKLANKRELKVGKSMVVHFAEPVTDLAMLRYLQRECPEVEKICRRISNSKNPQEQRRAVA